MKKILIAVVVICVPLFTIMGGFHYFGFVKKQIAIEELMAQTDNAYYKGLASVCYKKNSWEYPCCVESVKTMIARGAFATEVGYCGSAVAEKLACDGSYAWCLPAESPVEKVAEQKSCVNDGDCVAATCRHPTETINRQFAPQCAGHMCTMSCETILDCGQGKPVCEHGVCDVQTIKNDAL